MPLFLDAFRGILRDKSLDQKFALPLIHVYGFSKARDPEFDFHEVWLPGLNVGAHAHTKVMI